MSVSAGVIYIHNARRRSHVLTLGDTNTDGTIIGHQNGESGGTSLAGLPTRGIYNLASRRSGFQGPTSFLKIIHPVDILASRSFLIFYLLWLSHRLWKTARDKA